MNELLEKVRQLREILRYYASFLNTQSFVIIPIQDVTMINQLLNDLIEGVAPYSKYISNNLIDIANNLYYINNSIHTFNPFRFGALGYLLNYLESTEFICNYSRYITTPWNDINQALVNLFKEASMVSERLDYNKVGVVARELFIMLAKKVFDENIHKSDDGIKISSSDAKRMIEAYLNYELHDEKLKDYANASVRLAEPVTHSKIENKERMNAAVIAVANMVALISNIYQNNHINKCDKINI